MHVLNDLYDKIKDKPEYKRVSLNTMKKSFQALDPEKLGYISLSFLREQLTKETENFQHPLKESEMYKMIMFCSSKENERFYYNDYCLDTEEYLKTHLSLLKEKHKF